MSGISGSLRRLQAAVGENQLLTDTEAVSRYRVDGQMPVAVVLPQSVEEVAAVLRAAAESGLPLLLWGGGRHMHLGAPCGPIGAVVLMSGLNRVVAYDPNDLTVTAQAGMSLEALQKVVGEHGQMLPLDPPGGASATLGGIAATNAAGALRMSYGAPRDLIIGMRVALTDGSVIKTGGRTVKNVAGYELGKLFIGSLGTVGAICELTLRLVPRPEQTVVLVSAMDLRPAAAMAEALLSSRLGVTSIELLNPAAASRVPGLPVAARNHYVIVIGLMGEAEGIARQERDIRAMSGEAWGRLEGGAADNLRERVGALAYPEAEGVLVRASVPVGDVHGLVAMLSDEEGWLVLARPGDGVVYAASPASPPRVRRVVDALRLRAEGVDGHAVVVSAPAQVKRELSVWGRETANADLMRGLKQAFDAAGVLGCGRFVPGL